jgi:dolichyl-phosphate beta-glucosyltransferase
MEPYISVVIPAYNEESRLPATLKRVTEYLAQQSYTSEVLLVDDGSSDNTVSVSRAAFEALPDCIQCRVIENDHRGKGYTVRTGMLAAAGRYVLFSDADLATPIEELERMLAHLEAGADVVIGSREGLGAERLAEPWYRHLMGRIFNLMVRLIAGANYQDTQCGFKAFTSDAAQDLFGRLRLYGANAEVIQGAAVTAFDVEVLFLADKLGYEVREVPVRWSYGDATKVSPLRDSIRNFRDVVRVRLNDLRGVYREEE